MGFDFLEDKILFFGGEGGYVCNHPERCRHRVSLKLNREKTRGKKLLGKEGEVEDRGTERLGGKEGGSRAGGRIQRVRK